MTADGGLITGAGEACDSGLGANYSGQGAFCVRFGVFFFFN